MPIEKQKLPSYGDFRRGVVGDQQPPFRNFEIGGIYQYPVNVMYTE